jgi:hypothetical protein
VREPVAGDQVDAELLAAARGLDRLTELLGQVAADARRLAEQVAVHWVDDRGLEWSQRAGLVQRQLDREAAACAELAGQLARTGEEIAARRPDADSAYGAGPRLGGTAGQRADDARGMRIAVLPDPADAAPGPR